MAGTRLEWDGQRIQAAILAEFVRRLHRAALVVWIHWKSLINVDGTGVGKSGKLTYGANPSKPGEPPRKQTGRLLGSAAWEVAGLVARVGSNLAYARILELGGRFVAARPSLRRALKEKQDEVRRILAAPLKLR